LEQLKDERPDQLVSSYTSRHVCLTADNKLSLLPPLVTVLSIGTGGQSERRMLLPSAPDLE
jgi:hypothetical protein